MTGLRGHQGSKKCPAQPGQVTERGVASKWSLSWGRLGGGVPHVTTTAFSSRCAPGDVCRERRGVWPGSGRRRSGGEGKGRSAIAGPRGGGLRGAARTGGGSRRGGPRFREAFPFTQPQS